MPVLSITILVHKQLPIFILYPHLIGGPDQRYTLSSDYDLSKDKLIGNPQEIYGSIHTTLVNHYNDTQFFVVKAEPEGSTTIRVSDWALPANTYSCPHN